MRLAAGALALLTVFGHAPNDENIEFSQARRVFGAPKAQALVVAGQEGVRISGLNTWFRGGAPMISVLKSRAGRPRIEVRVRSHGRTEVMDAPAGTDVWAAASLLRTTTLTASVDGQNPGDMLCTDGWTTVVEAFETGHVVTRFRDICGPDPVADQASALIGLVLKAFPPCNRMSPELGDDLGRLQHCDLLSGSDRLGAADVFNRTLLELNSSGSDLDEVSDVFAPDVRLEDADAVTIGSGAVSEAWFRGYKRMHKAELFVGRVEASDDRAKVRGKIHRNSSSAEVAKFTQEWARNVDGIWRLQSWKIGRFRSDD